MLANGAQLEDLGSIALLPAAICVRDDDIANRRRQRSGCSAGANRSRGKVTTMQTAFQLWPSCLLVAALFRKSCAIASISAICAVGHLPTASHHKDDLVSCDYVRH